MAVARAASDAQAGTCGACDFLFDGLHLFEMRERLTQIGVVLEGLGDERVELRIGVKLPPAIGQRGAGDERVMLVGER